ncbi:hypothetical protein [Kribbella kalugense]|uniref:Uncharacterized protein n=1 Tax=Kribbella kalugense TaxID=2512221 RepID=A0A4R7ZUB4_9ACTN|nr:hypothetical protein [Kribbella kalugense]TDW21295.1 hypothetical protein EV650_0113 [Kribbella kalugense]
MEWRVFCASGPSDVYRAVSTSLGRERFWAGSAPESDGVISFVLADGRAAKCSIEQAVPGERYQLGYFGRTLTFTLTAGEAGGTDLTLSSDEPADCAEVVSLLLRLKASVDFGVDLRNHDTTRTTAYADS